MFLKWLIDRLNCLWMCVYVLVMIVLVLVLLLVVDGRVIEWFMVRYLLSMF